MFSLKYKWLINIKFVLKKQNGIKIAIIIIFQSLDT